MADFAASILAPVVESGVKYVAGKIKRQFIYLCCFASNIAALKDEARNLDDVAREVQARVSAAENNVQEIKPEIVTWLRDTDDINEKTTRILDEVPNVCLARFSLSRRALKTSEAMALHREKCQLFEADISMAPPSAGSKPTPLGTTYEFESRKQIEGDIMVALRGEEETMIGICGMGGLGKTTMAKRVMNKALEDGIFQEVVMAVVSQTVDELKIQVEIGETLGLKGLKKETQQVRVQKLYKRLTSSTKRTLIVLDDVWKIIKLKELGIPCGDDSKGCRILITSRNGDALKAMDVKKVFGLKELSKEEAWFLFEKNAGTCVEDVELNPVAKQVVSECKGLPIAIEIVGAYLKDERSKSVWKDALKQLRKPNPKNTPDFIADVYKPLMVSYDKLDNDEVKSLFLLCSLFPEDDIPLQKLAAFCMGLRIFEDIRSVEEVRDRVHALVKRLKTRSLLLDSEEKDRVRMHDVVRDIGIFTRKQREKSGGSNGIWISSNELTVGEESSEIPSLNVCLLLSTDDQIKIENTIFEGMRELYVLAVQRHSWTSLPQLPEYSLSTIRTLVLDSCRDMETISGVGGLVNLEILICCICTRIKELPHEIGGLKHLKVLDLSYCFSLNNIAPGIISSLVELEELKMMNSFTFWETDSGRDKNRYAGLGELESLTKLNCLEIEIRNYQLISQQIKLSTNIKRFHIQFGDYRRCPEGLSKKLCLTLDRGSCIGHWVENLIKNTEYLDIDGNGANDLDLAKFNNPNIRYLKLAECESMQNIGDDGRHTLFQHMEGLELSRLPLLQEAWNGPVSPISFKNLKEIHIIDLPALKQLGNSSTSVSLPQLQSLQIEGCGMMEQLFQLSQEEEGKNAADINDQHNYLHLFCQQQKVSFGRLKKLVMDRNPFCRHLGDIHASSFNQLAELCISKCDGNSSLFTPPIARNLTNLRKLSIVDCDEMIQVIEDENEDDIVVVGGGRLFPKLLEIELRNLSKLVSFGKWKCDDDDELPPLKRLIIMRCPNMTLPLVPTLHSEFINTDLNHYDLNPPENAFHHQIPLFLFHGLRSLAIIGYGGDMCIFSSSVACNLSNLRSLRIGNCNEMVRVIHVEEEERVSSGDQRTTATLLFPKLQQLHLWDAKKLEKFGEWKHDVELPLLKDLDIFECPKMRKFSLGVISTPHLKSVEIDETEYIMDASTDLNGMLQQHCLTRQKESMEEDMWEEMEMEIEEWKKMEMEMEIYYIDGEILYLNPSPSLLYQDAGLNCCK